MKILLGSAGVVGVLAGLGGSFSQSAENLVQMDLDQQENFYAAPRIAVPGATASYPEHDYDASCAFDAATGIGMVAKDGTVLDADNIQAIDDGCSYSVTTDGETKFFTTRQASSPMNALNNI